MSSELRAALDKIGSISAYVAKESGEADTAKYMNDIISIVQEIVAEPLKNCEVGTPEEQYNRFIYCCTERKISCRKTFNRGCAICYAKWMQMLYEKGGNDEQ